MSPRYFACCLAGGLLLTGLPCTGTLAEPPTRVALVVGVSAYQHFAPLDNPSQDHAAMVARLGQLGFAVMERMNPTREELRGLGEAFAKAYPQATEICFYYSGHGLQVQGRNYLTGIDSQLEVEVGLAELDRLGTLAGEALLLAKEAHIRQCAETGLVPLDGLLDRLDAMGGDGGARVVILDCCRDNPLGTKGLGSKSALAAKGGLGRVDPPRGTLIAFAAREGRTAAQTRAGETSLYTQCLLEKLDQPGIEVEQIFKDTRRLVHERSRGVQEPAEYTNLTGSFVFRRRESEPDPVKMVPPPSPSAPPSPQPQKPGPALAPRAGEKKNPPPVPAGGSIRIIK